MFINPRYSVFSLLFLASFSFARDSNESGVELEPSAFFGTLENGFRYASVNSGPKDECIVYLHADVGSLNEEADESGMAHFLEHMAFRGGKHFGPGQMVKTLQMMGMTVGPHLNATTSFTETIYQFELKKCTKSNLREVLYAARDISDGLLLLDADIESEKGPVDAEERLRASPVQERLLQDLSRAFTGSMLAEHYPIGIKSIRDTFTAQKVRRFYEKWYRPDSLKLVVVGGLFNLNNFVDKAMPEFFGDMKPGPVTERKQVQLDTIQPVFAAHKVETLPVSVVSSSRYLPQRLCMQDSLAIDKRTKLLAIARVLEQRLNEKTEEWGARDIKVVLTDQSLVHSGQEATSILLPALGLGCIVVSDPHQAQFAFDHVEKEIAQMIAGGISHKEFEAAIRDQKEAAPKYDQKYIAESLLNQARALRPFENMEVAKHNYLRTLNAFTEKEATKMLAEIWYGTPVISAIQPSDELSETDLSGIVDEAKRLSMQQMEIHSQPCTPYIFRAEHLKAGVVASRATDYFNNTEVSFSNGILIQIAPRSFMTSRTFSLDLRLALLPSENREELLLRYAFEHLATKAGIASHTPIELSRLFSESYRAPFVLNRDNLISLTWLSNRPRDLVTQFEFIFGYLKSPSLLERDVQNWKDGYRANYATDYLREFNCLVSNAEFDLSKCPPHPHELDALDSEKIIQYATRLLRQAHLTVSLDIASEDSVDEAIEAARRTLGALPARDPAPVVSLEAPTPKKGFVSGIRMEKIDPMLKTSQLVFRFPMLEHVIGLIEGQVSLDPQIDQDTIKRNNENAREILAVVLNNRLFQEIRIDLGTSYHISVTAHSAYKARHQGELEITLDVDPRQKDFVTQKVFDICQSLWSTITNEEIERASRQLESEKKIVQQLTVQQIAQVATQMLQKDLCSIMSLIPRKG